MDLTERSQAEVERDQLAIAIEQAAESVVIADLEARITYVNPAFERVTGYTRAEVIGQNPRLLSSGLQPRSFYEAMWAALTTGVRGGRLRQPAQGRLLITEEAVITPIRDPSGEVRATSPSSAT